MKKPDFIIIGAAKAGTTSLYHHLSRHPSVFLSTPKEPSYFAFEDRYAKGESWYLSLFQAAGETQVCGEASTNYTNWPLYPEVPSRMHALLPGVKLIYFMRHPVNRAYSHYLQLIHNIRTDNPDYKFTDTFEQHIKRDDSPIQSSNYMLQISRFLDFYPRENFLFLFFEDFIRDPANALAQVTDFLSIERKGDIAVPLGADAENRADNKNAWLIRSRLTAPLRALPGGQWLADHLPQGFRDRIVRTLSALPARKRIEADYIPPPMRPETRAQLLEYFREPNRELRQFLGMELPDWDK
jgi:hypothetical protein